MKGVSRGALHGVPIALKDLIDTQAHEQPPAARSSRIECRRKMQRWGRRLKSAGAVMLGKLNMHEFAYGDSSAPSHFGPVRNVEHRTRAGRLVWRIGGSGSGRSLLRGARLRHRWFHPPAGRILQHRGAQATYGLVSTRGVVPLSWSLDHIGPMCRTVADAALTLQPIAGHDPLDTNSVAATPPDYAASLRQNVSSVRLGIPRAVFYEGLIRKLSRRSCSALRVLQKLTASTCDVELPRYSTLPVVGAEAYTFHAPYFTKTPERYRDDTPTARSGFASNRGSVCRGASRARSPSPRRRVGVQHCGSTCHADNSDIADHRHRGAERSRHAPARRGGPVITEYPALRHLWAAVYLGHRAGSAAAGYRSGCRSADHI